MFIGNKLQSDRRCIFRRDIIQQWIIRKPENHSRPMTGLYKTGKEPWQLKNQGNKWNFQEITQKLLFLTSMSMNKSSFRDLPLNKLRAGKKGWLQQKELKYPEILLLSFQIRQEYLCKNQIIFPNLCKVILKTFGELDQARKRHRQLLLKEGGVGHNDKTQNFSKT